MPTARFFLLVFSRLFIEWGRFIWKRIFALCPMCRSLCECSRGCNDAGISDSERTYTYTYTYTLMFILKMLRVTLDGVVPIAMNPGRPATFFMCSCRRVTCRPHHGQRSRHGRQRH